MKFANMNMTETKAAVIAHIIRTKDVTGVVTVNQHEVGNKYNLNSGSISKVLKQLRVDRYLVQLTRPAPGRPAVYKVCF